MHFAFPKMNIFAEKIFNKENTNKMRNLGPASLSLKEKWMIACSRLSVSEDDPRLSVSEDDRKSERATSGIRSERDPDLSFFLTRLHSSPARFFNPPLTESLEQAKWMMIQFPGRFAKYLLLIIIRRVFIWIQDQTSVLT